MPGCFRAAVLLSLFFSSVSCCVFPPASCFAQNFKAEKKEIPAISPPEAFLKTGERLSYSVEWLGFNVGWINLEVKDAQVLGGRECFHVIARAYANSFLSAFYDIEYTVHSFIDKQTLNTLRFEKTRRLKDKVTHTKIDFDYVNKKVNYAVSGNAPAIVLSSQRPQMEKEIARSFEILDGTEDLLSSLYFFRLMKIGEEKSYTVNVYYDARNWPMQIKVGKPFLSDIRRKGVMAVFEAVMSSGLSQFILGKSMLSVLFTADSRRIPLRFRLATGVGPITGFIQEIPK